MRRQWGVSVLGGVGALALHLLLFSAFTLGTTAGNPPRRQRGYSEVELPQTDQGAVAAIIYMDPTTVSKEMGLAAPARLRPLKPKAFLKPRLMRLALTRVGRSGDADGDASKSGTSAAAVDGPGRAVLFGRYVNQIAARVERDWVRPNVAPRGATLWGPVASGPAAGAAERSPGAAAPALFKCRVQILQSRSGKVLEVTLLACDSSPEWQQSLVNAIDAASPLPSPPDESVFARALVLNFTSAPSLSGSALRAGGTRLMR